MSPVAAGYVIPANSIVHAAGHTAQLGEVMLGAAKRRKQRGAQDKHEHADEPHHKGQHVGPWLGRRQLRGDVGYHQAQEPEREQHGPAQNKSR